METTTKKTETKPAQSGTRVLTLRLVHSDDGVLVIGGSDRDHRTIVPHILDGIVPGYLVHDAGGLVYHIPASNVTKAIISSLKKLER